MSDEQRLSGALQENILTLLCFDDKHCKLVRAAVTTPKLFESSIFREIAGIAIDFIDQYGEAVKDHLPDHLEGILKGDDTRKAASYSKLVTSLFDNREVVNAEYVMQELHKFVRLQNLKSAFVLAAEALEDGRIDQAEVELQKGLNTQVVSFEAGLNFSDRETMIGLLDDLEEPGFNIGIPDFDKRGIIPRRKELLVLIAPRGKGKSWFCTHVAKWALLQRWSVVVITLEMSQKRYAARFLQSFFSISKRDATIKVAEFVHTRDGELTDIIHREIERATLQDENIRDLLAEKIKREFRKRPPLVIKQFPTGGMTIDQLEAYLDGLERFEGITPDLLIIDYPHLMKHRSDNKRAELGQIMEQIRGIGVKRNCATVAVSQGNRESESATVVTGAMAAEDISVLATADVLFTYSQTPAEKKLGLARLTAEKARNDADKFAVLMSQAYGIGQFCLDSTLLRGDYWEVMESKGDGDQPRQNRRKTRDDD